MAMIDIEYRYSAEPPSGKNIRRQSISEMSDYLKGLVSEMLLSDISARFTATVYSGPNMVYINGRSIPEVLEGLDIKPLESENSCDVGNTNIIKFGRPTLDWNKDIIEDIPDVLVKNAISKTFADITKNKKRIV